MTTAWRSSCRYARRSRPIASTRQVRARVKQSAMANTGYSGMRAAVATALTVHLGQQRPAKSLYFHIRDLALYSR